LSRKNEAARQPTAGGIKAAEALVPQLAASEPAVDLEGRFAGASLRAIAEAGLLALNVPARSGGLGETLSGTVETLRVLAHGSPSAALMLSMHTSVLANLLIDVQHVPESQRAEFVKRREWAFAEAAAGRIFAVANSEPGAAGEVKNSRATANDGHLNGLKSFCTMGTNADYFMAAARDEFDHVDYYLVANREDAVRTAAPWDGIGMRGSESVLLRFENAPIVGPLAYRGAVDGVNNRHWATLSFTAIFVGIAESMLEDVCHPGSGILQQSSAVELHLTVEACRAFLRHCVGVEDQPATDAYRRLVRDCKTFVTRSLAAQATAAFTAQGGSAYRFSSPLSRKLRDLLAGPALRPPASIAFDAIWKDLSS
jgi:alkylation response protein AidB-like acyl-CoA dehydrogenase